MNRCVAEGCGRWTRAGEAFCRRHGSHDGEGTDERGSESGGGQDRLAIFRARLAAGDYDAVLGPGLRGAEHVAANPGLDAEVGALRLALARLLDEEADASRLATGVARVASVAVQAARLRRGHDNEAEKISVYLQRELAAIDAERAERTKGSHEAKGGETA